jgi:hypothetical protein
MHKISRRSLLAGVASLPLISTGCSSPASGDPDLFNIIVHGMMGLARMPSIDRGWKLTLLIPNVSATPATAATASAPAMPAMPAHTFQISFFNKGWLADFDIPLDTPEDFTISGLKSAGAVIEDLDPQRNLTVHDKTKGWNPRDKAGWAGKKITLEMPLRIHPLSGVLRKAPMDFFSGSGAKPGIPTRVPDSYLLQFRRDRSAPNLTITKDAVTSYSFSGDANLHIYAQPKPPFLLPNGAESMHFTRAFAELQKLHDELGTLTANFDAFKQATVDDLRAFHGVRSEELKSLYERYHVRHPHDPTYPAICPPPAGGCGCD